MPSVQPSIVLESYLESVLKLEEVTVTKPKHNLSRNNNNNNNNNNKVFIPS